MAEPVISHKEWMKLTYGGATSVRSGRPKAVDRALEQFHLHPDPAHKGALQQALTAWITDTGSDWKSSVRNGHNAASCKAACTATAAWPAWKRRARSRR